MGTTDAFGLDDLEAMHEIRDEMILGLSVGFSPEVDDWDFTKEYAPELGQLDHVVRKQARLFEVSVVSTPAYVGAQITKVESVQLDEAARSAERSAQFEAAALRQIQAGDELTDLRDWIRKERSTDELRRWKALAKDLRRRRQA
jgi:hypothetical protein